VDSPYPWRALLCLNGMSGYHETPVLVIGETPRQYRIEVIERVRLAGRMQWLNPGRYLKCSLTRTSNGRSPG
jgi:hypothetical protein